MGVEDTNAELGCKDGRYKNNDGNSSLGLVPIHRSQPRLFTMSDYCYSDRLLHMAEAFSATPGFLVVPVTAEPSGCPFPRRGVVPGRSVFQVLLPISRRILYQFQITCDRSHSFSVPSDSIIERSFPVFADLLNIFNAKFLLSRLRLS